MVVLLIMMIVYPKGSLNIHHPFDDDDGDVLH